eukprot:m51a1_g10569 hypothetical protein (170) ;mRNA; r:43952-44699
MSSAAAAKRNPTVRWAERKSSILLTVDVQDVAAPAVALEPQRLTFDYNDYSLNLELSKEIDPEKSRLNKAGKPAWLQIDWSRWVDEDDEDEKPAGADFADLGGMGGAPGNFDFEGADEEDSDDDEMPDLEADAPAAAAAAAAAAPAEGEQKKEEEDEEAKKKASAEAAH